MNEPESMEYHHSHRVRKKKIKKERTPKKRRGRNLPLFLKVFIMVLLIMVMVISTSSHVTINEPSATVVHIKTPPSPVLKGTRIPEFKTEDIEKKIEKEDGSIEEKLWHNRPGAIVSE